MVQNLKDKFSLRNLHNVILGISDYKVNQGDTIIILSNDDLDYFLSSDALQYLFDINLDKNLKKCSAYRIFQRYKLTRANQNKTALFSILRKAFEDLDKNKNNRLVLMNLK